MGDRLACCSSMFKFMVWAFLGCWLRNAQNVSDVSVDVSDVSEVLMQVNWREKIQLSNLIFLISKTRVYIGILFNLIITTSIKYSEKENIHQQKREFMRERIYWKNNRLINVILLISKSRVDSYSTLIKQQPF